MRLIKLLLFFFAFTLCAQDKQSLVGTPTGLVHVFLEADADYTPSVTQNDYTKITPGFSSIEVDGFIVDTDTLTALFKGGYFMLLSFDIREGVNTDYNVQIRINNIVVQQMRVTTTSATNYQPFILTHYIDDLVVDDDISFYITNLSNNNDPVLAFMHFYIRREHE